MIFSLSNGLTTVLEAAPAHPPATKYDAISGVINDNGRLLCDEPAELLSAAVVMIEYVI
jgi:hypothetical protein